VLPVGKENEKVEGLTSHLAKGDLRKMNQVFLKEIHLVSKIRHPCITTVMGAVPSKGNRGPLLVMEYMEFGSLRDLLKNTSVHLNGEIVFPVLRDVTQGMRFLHSADPPLVHSDLKAANVLVDSSFRGKVADFGLSQKRRMGAVGTPFFVAPQELLRMKNAPNVQTDIYAFGITLCEIFARQDPYHGERCLDVLREVADPTRKPHKRPRVPSQCPAKIESLMQDCWREDPTARPTFVEIDRRMKAMDPLTDFSFPESARSSLTAARASQSIEDRFSPNVVGIINKGLKVEPERKEMVSVLICRIASLGKLRALMDPARLDTLIKRLCQVLDRDARMYDVQHIETSGENFLFVTNLMTDQSTSHALSIALFATAVNTASKELLLDSADPTKGYLKLRIGLHAGPVVVCVLGRRDPKYTLLGDTMNTASRCESTSSAGDVQCTHQFASLVKEQDVENKLSLDCKGAVKVQVNATMEAFVIRRSGEKSSHGKTDDRDSSGGGDNDGMQSVNLDARTKTKKGSAVIQLDHDATWDKNMQAFQDGLSQKELTAKSRGHSNRALSPGLRALS